MTAKELIGWIQLVILAAAAAMPGSTEAMVAVRLVSKLVGNLDELLDGKAKEEDLRLPSYAETLAEVKAARPA